MKYKIGDRVRIVRSREDQEHWNSLGGMDKYLGTIMTVDGTRTTGDGTVTYLMREDNGMWWWYEYMIDCKEENKMFGKSDLVNGDILFMRNGNCYVVMKNYIGADFDTWVGLSGAGWCDPSGYYENMSITCPGTSDNWDVVKVMRPKARYANPFCYKEENYKVVFDRNAERKKMTVEDIERELGYKIAVVDKDGVERG